MLKQHGFSLLEMLLSIALSSMMIISATVFYPALHAQLLSYYQQVRLEQTVHYAMAALSKDIRRAGFIANHPEKMTESAIELNSAANCIMIRYDSESRGDWIYTPSNPTNSDLFTYRYYKNNVEYKTGSPDCYGSNWEKIFDPAEINVTQFLIKFKPNVTEVNLTAELTNNIAINYRYAKLIKNENLL